MGARTVQFEWDETKADSNVRKHGVTFESASTVFQDPNLLTVADLEHSQGEDRWFSIGRTGSGVLLTIVYLWSEADPDMIKVRVISARKATREEARQYEESL